MTRISETCNFDESTGIASFDFTDISCLDVNYINDTEIEYVATFQKQIPEELVERHNLNPVLISYSMSCVGRFYDIITNIKRRKDISHISQE